MAFRMKQLLFALFTFLTVVASAQRVGYIHKGLTAYGCRMKYSVVKQDSSYCILANVISERMTFRNEPTMKIRTFNDEVITLKGTVVGGNSQSVGVISGNFVLPVTELSYSAQFPVTPEEFKMLNNGVSKVHLSMTPLDHEHTFKKDKIGKKLYQFYLNAKAKDDSF